MSLDELLLLKYAEHVKEWIFHHWFHMVVHVKLNVWTIVPLIMQCNKCGTLYIIIKSQGKHITNQRLIEKYEAPENFKVDWDFRRHIQSMILTSYTTPLVPVMHVKQNVYDSKVKADVLSYQIYINFLTWVHLWYFLLVFIYDIFTCVHIWYFLKKRMKNLYKN